MTIPIVFDGCFGWLHKADGKHGVVMCGALGDEANIVHRPWRELAGHLAAAGLPTLRFDYPATGDSAGEGWETDRPEAWLLSVHGAVRFLRERTAVETLTLIGFRFGAALAVACAETRGDVEALALLAPVTSGRAYGRELAVLARLRQHRVASDPDDEPEADGIPVTAETLAALGRIEILRSGRSPARRALILRRDDMAADPHFADRLRTLGVAVEEGLFTDYSRLRWQADWSPWSAAAFGRVAEWTTSGARPGVTQPLCAGELVIPLPGLNETAATFGPAPGLFGLCCEPAEPRTAGRPAVMFLSPGMTPHVGDGRMWVPMARRFARAGFASLRLDVAGVGDSPPRAGEGEPADGWEQAIADVRIALDWLEARGYPQAVLIGNCLGAKLACNVSLRDPRVAAQLLVNPWHQFWASRNSPFHTPVRYLRLLRRRSTWWNILTGAVPGFILRQAARRLARGLMEALARRLSGKEAAHGAAARAAARAAVGRIRGLAERNVHTVLIYGEGDSLLPDLEEYFAMDRIRLAERLRVELRLLSGVEHLFPRRSDRDRLAAILLEQLRAKWK